MTVRGLTARRRRLLRYSLASIGIVLLVGALIWVREDRSAGEEPIGIADVLRRELPVDAPAVRFTDEATAAGVRFRHFDAERSRLLPEDMGSGLGWGDCDQDGRDDLYVVNFAAPLPASEQELHRRRGNALFRNLGGGVFEEISGRSGAGLTMLGLGVSWADYDGDGDLDLYVTGYGPNYLLQNDGACGFVDVTAEAGLAGGAEEFSAGASWGDYDGDGDLDLYVTSYVVFDVAKGAGETASLQFGQAVPYTLNPASFEPARNRLYRNDEGRFVDVAEQAGVTNPGGRSLSAAWVDFDEDGDQDLYVANDVSDNALFLNRGDGTFDDISASSLTADYRGAMGIAVTDFDRDGDQDFFVTHWIAQENGLYRNHLEVDAAGGLFFADIAEMMGLGYSALQFVGWGTDFLDVDNDGWKDLFVANGHTIEDSTDPNRLLSQRMQLFWSRAGDGFYDLSAVAGPVFERPIVGRGAAAADYDGDGAVDFAVVDHGGSLILARNQTGSDHHWLQIDLRQPGRNPFAVGARVALEAGETIQTHRVGASPSYLSANALRVHFGLGELDRVVSVTVRWPDGAEERFDVPEVDRRVILVRGSGH